MVGVESLPTIFPTPTLATNGHLFLPPCWVDHALDMLSYRFLTTTTTTTRHAWPPFWVEVRLPVAPMLSSCCGTTNLTTTTQRILLLLIHRRRRLLLVIPGSMDLP